MVWFTFKVPESAWTPTSPMLLSECDLREKSDWVGKKRYSKIKKTQNKTKRKYSKIQGVNRLIHFQSFRKCLNSFTPILFPECDLREKSELSWKIKEIFKNNKTQKKTKRKYIQDSRLNRLIHFQVSESAFPPSTPCYYLNVIWERKWIELEKKDIQKIKKHKIKWR